MGTHQFTEYLGTDELVEDHKDGVIRPSAEQKWDGPQMLREEEWDAPVKARYGGDELWASKALGAGTDVVNEELWD